MDILDGRDSISDTRDVMDSRDHSSDTKDYMNGKDHISCTRDIMDCMYIRGTIDTRKIMDDRVPFRSVFEILGKFHSHNQTRL